MILITGGTGKTGRRLAERLGSQARVASRHSEVRFDWQDPSTWAAALEGVEAVYLVAPVGVVDLLPVMQPFLQQAAGKRFVLLSSSALPEGGPLMGAVHAWLRQHAPHWVVLRPSWFMQNFLEPRHLQTIATNGAIYSATGDGRVAFIDAEDIAAVAAVALSEPDFPSGELILTGPEALSYGEVARIIGEQIGRPISHQNLSVDQLARAYLEAGIPSEYAHGLATLDLPIAAGSEDRTTSEVERVTGRPPTRFRDFARAAW